MLSCILKITVKIEYLALKENISQLIHNYTLGTDGTVDARRSQTQGQGSRNEIQLQLNMKFVATQSIEQRFYNQQQYQHQCLNKKRACNLTTFSIVSAFNNTKRVLCNKRQKQQLQQRQYWKHKNFCIAAS